VQHEENYLCAFVWLGVSLLALTFSYAVEQTRILQQRLVGYAGVDKGSYKWIPPLLTI